MKRIYLIILFCISINCVNAQRNIFNLNYSVAFPLSDANDFISKTSWRGANLSMLHYLEPGIAVGVETGWNAFYDNVGYTTITDGTQALSGTQYRYGSCVPVLFNLNYYLMPDEVINPFVSLGVGTMYSRSDIDMGMYRARFETWHFALKPELGLQYETGATSGINFSAKYFHAFKTNELKETRNYLSLNLGFYWKY
ncbi:MAG: hypothetical protein JNK61_10335 [Bacteroidia bacterium]|nr:hypothetical protein [Bacteroidia bacterium]HQV00055.1 hypothetical protein [Bacteroidia bacterium]